MGKRRRGPKAPNFKEEMSKVKKVKRMEEDPSDYIYEDVDRFHLAEDKLLLNTEDSLEDSDEGSNEEEVLGLNLADEAENEDDNVEEYSEDEVEDDEVDVFESREHKIPSDKAWGKRKKSFYDADVKDDDIFASDEEAERAAQDEEDEALALQLRLNEALDETDFHTVNEDSSYMDERRSTQDEKNVKVAKDLSQMSKEEKLEILVSESPELPLLIDELEEKVEEVSTVYIPLMALSKKPGILSKEGTSYINSKYKLLLNYCVNINFYLYLKSRQQNVKNHPVMKRIFEHQKLLKELAPLDAKLRHQVDFLLTKGQEVTEKKEDLKGTAVDAQIASVMQIAAKKKKHRKPDLSLDKGRSEQIDPLAYYNKMKKVADEVKTAKKNPTSQMVMDEASDDSMDEDSKRGITYEMAKNKGLTRKRKKELRNPRVKHKVKFKKAVIKRKSQVREVKKELHRYCGEGTGIKANVVKSVKIR